MLVYKDTHNGCTYICICIGKEEDTSFVPDVESMDGFTKLYLVALR